VTDKELLQQLLRRNHQLTAKCEGLTKRIEYLEGKHPPTNDRLAAMHEALSKKVQMLAQTRPPIQVLNKSLGALEEMMDSYWHKMQILSVIVDWAVEKLGGDFDSFYEQAENVVNKGRLEVQFEEPTTDAEDGHS
jgi:hypothetical protein